MVQREMRLSRNEWRNLLNRSFSNEEIADISFFHFPEVYDEFADGMTRGSKLRLLIAFCERQGLYEKLLEIVKEKNPNQYQKLLTQKSSQLEKGRCRITISLGGNISYYSPKSLSTALDTAVMKFIEELKVPLDAVSISETDLTGRTILLEMPTAALVNSVRIATGVLHSLVNILDTVTRPDIITLDDMLLRYRLTGLGEPALRAITQSQRNVRAIGNYDQVGLCEFHIGLTYLHFEDFEGAIHHFEQARYHWKAISKGQADSLACFAEGIAYHHTHQYEKATTCYRETGEYLSQIETVQPIEEQVKFTEALGEQLVKYEQALQVQVWPPEVS